MSGDFHCWYCKEPLDEHDDKCERCDEGTICPSCGKCRCDYQGKGGSALTPQSARALFEKLVDESEEIRTTRTPDLEPVEREVMAALIQEAGIAGAVAPRLIRDQVTPMDFQTESLMAIAEMIFPLAKTGQVINQNVMTCVFKDAELRKEAVGLCTETYEAQALPTYLEAIKNASRRTLALMAMADTAQELLGGDANMEGAFGAITKAREELIRPTNLVSMAKPERDDWLRYCQELEEHQQENDFLGFDTGLAHYNRVSNGLTEGLTVVAGPPSVGKTSFANQMQHETARRNQIPTVFFSYEQSRNELRVKALARQSKVNSRSILRGKLSTDMAQWEKVETAAAELYEYSGLIHLVEADAHTTIDKMQLIIERVMLSNNTTKCAVFVDYLQIIPLAPGRTFGSKRENVSFICSELRRLCRELHVPIVAISSESRASYNKRTFEAFKESGEIEYSCDIAATFQTDKQRTKELFEGGSTCRAVKLAVLKNRNGEVATIDFMYYPELSWFKEESCVSSQYHEALPGEED